MLEDTLCMNAGGVDPVLVTVFKDESVLQRQVLLRLNANPFVHEIGIEPVALGDAGN